MAETFERADSLRRILNVMAFTPAVSVAPYIIGVGIESLNSNLTFISDNVILFTIISAPLGFTTFLILLVLALNFWLQSPRLQSPIQVMPNWSKQMRWATICSTAPFVAYLGLIVSDSTGPRWYLQDEIQLPANTLIFGSIGIYIYGLIQIAVAKIIDKKNGEPIS